MNSLKAVTQEDSVANPRLQQLTELGTSVWLDFIQRDLMSSGKLQKLIDEYCVAGLTANPTIFEKAIVGSALYDSTIEREVKAGRSVDEIFDAIAYEDIGAACDVLRQVYDRTNGLDGYVSIEVGPELANDTQGTIEAARRYWKAVNRPNLLIKVPATKPGIPAISTLLGEGINVNITLIFSIDRYKAVMNAYLDGLEKLAAGGKPVDRLASVASFFVSRVDTAVDKQLEAKIAAGGPDVESARALLGKAAVANAQIAYEEFKNVFGGERFGAMKAEGARVQRPLWASTSTKNPAYRDVIYVEELAGPDIVNTMPLNTIEAFGDHGVVERRIDKDIAAAHETMYRLAGLGIDMNAVTKTLEEEGVASFTASIVKLREALSKKRDELLQAARQ